MMNKVMKQAVVIGGSIAGLMTARVLSDHFAQVTILERDAVSLTHPEARKGQPQARHLHGLLASGREVMTHYFPDLPQALVDNGAVVGDFGETMHWYMLGGYRKNFTMAVPSTTMSRPLLEHLIRVRVLALPNVTLRDNCGVRRLLTTADKKRITGVEIHQRGMAESTEQLFADLVIDCTGRGSRSPMWLADLGYEKPAVSEVKVNVGYATRVFRRTPADPRGKKWFLITPDAPRETRFGGVFPVEGERWICSLGGWLGDHAPLDNDSFLAFARSLPASDIYDIIADAEPLSDVVPHKFPASLRRHYEKLRCFPDGYLVLGDAISSFNPTYGQGMTSASLQAAELDKLLAKRKKLDGLAHLFFKRAARVIDIPWQLAVGEDFRFPETTGPKPPGTDLINRYVTKVHQATLHDEVVGMAFLRVMNLMAPPQSLFHPRILWRVLRADNGRLPAATSLQPAVGD